MGHLQCEGKEDIGILLNHMRRWVGAFSIASFVGKVCAEDSVRSLYDVMEEMIRGVNVLLISALYTRQVMRGGGEIDRCGVWKLSLFFCRQMAR